MRTDLIRNKRGLKQRRVNYPLLNQLLEFAEADGRAMYEICERAGYHGSTLSMIRRGQRDPAFTLVINVGEVLGYELVWRKR